MEYVQPGLTLYLSDDTGIELLTCVALHCFFDAMFFYTCYIWTLLFCYDLKEFSLEWLLLTAFEKTISKHYLAQQRLWWKFLLNAAWKNLTMGIVSELWLLTVKKTAAFFYFHLFYCIFLGSTSCKMCIVLYRDHFCCSLKHVFYTCMLFLKKWNISRYYFFGFGVWLEETCKPCV